LGSRENEDEEALVRFRATAALRIPLVSATLAATCAASDPPKQRYVFVENTDRWVGLIRGEAYLIGKLDKNGDFTSEMKLRPDSASSAGVPVHGLLNGSNMVEKKVYEFRSGVLVPGEIRKDGNFVPEVGGKIIAFADYTYTPDATPIWNLPGGFRPEKPPEKPADKKK
jgi:hypothetical protein